MYMPANTALVMCAVLMQRDKAVWGEDAEEFRPDRWDSGEGDEGMKGREGFAAWNLGPRMVSLLASYS
jgi:cytochrome P450